MSKEIELKLRLPPSQARRLLAHPLLAGVEAQTFRLLNVYYDTPGFDLRRRGVALRLRRKGSLLWLMTVKGGDPASGALAQRDEWEALTSPGVFDFDIVTDARLRDFLRERQDALQVVFTTRFTRTAWRLAYAGATVELALDRGTISAPGGEAGAQKAVLPISEIELELIAGKTPDALFALAIELAADLAVHPEALNKAERGYALADGVPPPPAKTRAAAVRREMTPVEAFRTIALDCLAQLQRNENGALAGENPEYVHQARVAIRRLRSAMRLFAPILNPRFVELYAPRWRSLAGRLGGARDWDVFLAETLRPLEEAFPGDPDLALLRAQGEAAQAKAQSAAGVALRERDYSRLLLAFYAALFRVEPPTIGTSPAHDAKKLDEFAAEQLQKRLERIRRLARDKGKKNAEAWHVLRIAGKKLRYALEFFAAILPRKRLVKALNVLSKLQDRLGVLNDQATASRLIAGMHAAGEPDPLTRGWLAGRSHLLISELESRLRCFMALKKPWG